MLVALTGLGGCLDDEPPPESYRPPQLSPEALTESVDALMALVYSPPSPEWYDSVWPAMIPLRSSWQEEAAVPAMRVALYDRDPVVRRSAAFILESLAHRWWDSRPDEIATALLAALADDDAQVRESAVRGLSYIQSDPTLEEAAIARLDDPSPRVRWAASTALIPWDRSDDVAAPLLRALYDQDTRTRYVAAFGLQRFIAGQPNWMHETATKLTVQMANGEPPDHHIAAYQLVLSAIPIDERHLADFVDLEGSPDSVIRRAAAYMIDGLLRRQYEEGNIDQASLLRQLSLHRKDLAHEDPEVRANAAWSLWWLHEMDDTSLPYIEEALESETDGTAYEALRIVRDAFSGVRTSSWPLEWGQYRGICLTHRDLAIMGLRPWDHERKVVATLGDTVRVTATYGEDDGGPHIVYGYEYPSLEVDIARVYTQRIATRSPSVVVAGGLRVGATRQDALALLQLESTPEALAARRFMVHDCDSMDQTVLNLDFGQDGRIVAMELVGHGP